MAADILSRIQIAKRNAGKSVDFNLKPEQVQCFEHLYRGYDVIAVLPTGFGKSILFQLLPDVLATKSTSNIVIVVCPLTSIISDQVQVLATMGIKAGVLRVQNQNQEDDCSTSLFDALEVKRAKDKYGEHEQDHEDEDGQVQVDVDIIRGNAKIVFTHPEDLLSSFGRKVMRSAVFQRNVAACVIDEGHCVEMW